MQPPEPPRVLSDRAPVLLKAYGGQREELLTSCLFLAHEPMPS